DMSAAFLPGKPSEHGNRKSRGQGHVGRSCVSKANHAGGGGDHQSAIKFEARTKTAKEQIYGNHPQGSVEPRRNAHDPISNAKKTVRDHRLPIVENRLLQPRLSSKHWSNPVIAGKHFTRDLRVTRFVGSQQPEVV